MSSPRVLLVGAADLAQELAQTILWGKDVEVVIASTVAAALEVARSFHPSLVLIDGADAAATAALVGALRESPGAWRASLAVIARSASPSDHEAFRHAGANVVLEGPPDPAAWNVRLERVLAVPRRVKARLPLRLSRWPAREEEKQPLVALALDISMGGMLLETSQPMELGAKWDLRFVLPGQAEELRAVGAVVRVAFIEGRHRCAIELLTLHADAQERIGQFMDALIPQTTFGRYEVTGLIGEGSMGRVYSAFDPLAKRTVAIKTLRPEHLSGQDAEEYLRRFRREAQAAGKLVHPNIITVFDVGDDYFVMELLEGTTLRMLVAEQGTLELEDAIRILEPVAEALDVAHSIGTIHRDIKPANIMILRDGRPKIMDFGIAHLTSGVITAGGQFYGSPAYMAPEQIMRSEASAQSDHFSLAIVAYEMLTGRKPFEGDSITSILYNVANVDPLPPTQWNGRLPPFLDAVFRRALSRDPAARFTTTRAFVAALKGEEAALEADAAQAAAPEATVPTEEAKPHRSEETVDLSEPSGAPGGWLARWGSRRARLIAAGVVLLGVGLGLRSGGLSLRPRPKVLPPPPGIAVTTEPVIASVWLDGVEMGQAPLYLTNLAPGPHAVKVGRQGYSSAEVALEVPADGPPVPMRFTLQPLSTALAIDSEPRSGSVSVDGKGVGTTPLAGLTLSPGRHEVLVQRRGFRTWTRTIEVKPGERLSVLARLESEAPTRAERKALALTGWVREGDLVELDPGVTPPQRIAGDQPPYPEAAKKLHLSGTVSVEMTVTERGEVKDPHVIDSAGEVLDQAMLSAVRNWRYAPAEKNGVKVKVKLRVQEHFGR